MVRRGGGTPRLARLLDSKDWPTLVHCTNGPHSAHLHEFRRRSGGAEGSRSRCYINNAAALLVSKGSC